jgi:hypothetical protein
MRKLIFGIVLLLAAVSEANQADFTNNGIVNFADLAVLADAWGAELGGGNWNQVCDISEPNDNVIDGRDARVFAENWLSCKTVNFRDYWPFAVGYAWESEVIPDWGFTLEITDHFFVNGYEIWEFTNELLTYFGPLEETLYYVYVDGTLYSTHNQADLNDLPEIGGDLEGEFPEVVQIGVPTHIGGCGREMIPRQGTLGDVLEGTGYSVGDFPLGDKTDVLGFVDDGGCWWGVTVFGRDLGPMRLYDLFVIDANLNVNEPNIAYQIGDCTMEDKAMVAVDGNSGEPNFSVWVEGRYIRFEDTMYANCCPDEVGLEEDISGTEITLYEMAPGGGCYCMCYFPITASLGPFEDGTYTVEVIDNYGQSLGVVEVTIGEAGMSYQIDECDIGAKAVAESDGLRFSVTVDYRNIYFEDMMRANCCPDELELEMTVGVSLIRMDEIEYTSGGCKCMCDYPVSATLGPFEAGSYTFEVYEDHGGFIGSTIVAIEP